MAQDDEPFHRKRSPTQTFETAQKQVQSGEIWGRPHRWSGKFPKVKAYSMPLCVGEVAGAECASDYGIEFRTRVEPSHRQPNGVVLWSLDKGPVEGLRWVDDETIALTATLCKVYYPETES